MNSVSASAATVDTAAVLLLGGLMTGAKECWSLLHGAPDGVLTMHMQCVVCLFEEL